MDKEIEVAELTAGEYAQMVTGEKLAKELTYEDLGKPIGVQNNVAFYLGELHSIGFYRTGSVYLTVKRNGAEAKPVIAPDAVVMVEQSRATR